MSVRDRIERHMRRLNLSRAELARRSGISKGHITTIFSAGSNLTLETLERLAYALKVSPVELIGEFPALLSFVHSDNIPLEDYLRLKEEVPDEQKPQTVEEWRRFYQQWKTDAYPGLAAYLERTGLRYEDLVPLIQSLQRRNMPLPRAADAWEQQHRWFQAFPPN